MEKLIGSITRKQAKEFEDEHKKQINEKRQYEQDLYDWFIDFIDDAETRMTSKGYMRFLHNLCEKKNKKAVDKVVKYLAKEKSMDIQLLNFMKPFILENFSDWACETYNDIRMGC